MAGDRSNNLNFRTSTSTSRADHLQQPLLSPIPSPSSPLSSHFILVTMASRRLAFNLNQALRSRAALKSVQPMKRGFASPITLPSTTQSTTLSNGFTVWKDDSITLEDLLRTIRLQLSTLHTPRPPPLACGSMLAAEPRPTKQMEQRTSWNILPSRYINVV